MKEKCNYSLRAGFIIHCPTFHDGKIYTNDNLTDAVAAEYLAAFPGQRPMFAKVAESAAVKPEEPATIEIKVKKPKNNKKK